MKVQPYPTIDKETYLAAFLGQAFSGYLTSIRPETLCVASEMAQRKMYSLTVSNLAWA